jgi:hypothetical protein
MKKILQSVLLIIPPVLFAAGCAQSPAEPEVTDPMLYFKNYDLQSVRELTEGLWKTIPEGRYLRCSAKKIYQDAFYTSETVEWKKNDYGYEYYFRSNAFEDTIWLISLTCYHDTLYYTSPEYPPRNSWMAVKISAEEYEKKRQEVLFNRHLGDVACPPEAVSGRDLVYDIVGRWQLMRDTEAGIDCSCDEIVYDFRTDDTLVITDNRPDYLAPAVQDYLFEICHDCWWYLYSPKYYELTIDGVRVERNEVLEKLMFLGDDSNPSAKIFVRIE